MRKREADSGQVRDSNSKRVTPVQRWRHRWDKTEVAAADLIGRRDKMSFMITSGSELNRSSSSFSSNLLLLLLWLLRSSSICNLWLFDQVLNFFFLGRCPGREMHSWIPGEYDMEQKSTSGKVSLLLFFPLLEKDKPEVDF